MLRCSVCKKEVVVRPPVGWKGSGPRPPYSHEAGSALCKVRGVPSEPEYVRRKR